MRRRTYNKNVRTRTRTLSDVTAIADNTIDLLAEGRVYSIQPMSVNSDNSLVYDIPSNFEGSNYLSYNYFQTHGFYSVRDASLSVNGTVTGRDAISNEILHSWWGWDPNSAWASGDADNAINDWHYCVYQHWSVFQRDGVGALGADSTVPIETSGQKRTVSGSNNIPYPAYGYSSAGNNLTLSMPISWGNVGFKTDECVPLAYNSLTYRYGQFNLSTADLLPMNVAVGSISGLEGDLIPPEGDDSQLNRLVTGRGANIWKLEQSDQPVSLGGSDIRRFGIRRNQTLAGLNVMQLTYIPTAYSYTRRFEG